MASRSESEESPKSEPLTEPDPLVGVELDRYTIVRLLARGGMGRIYEARHTRLSRRVAIKFLLPEFASNTEILRRFENEAQAAGALEHPNVAAVLDSGRTPDGAPYMVMEYLQGEDCGSLLQRTGPLPAVRAVNLIMQACRGLTAAHQAGIVHRDLKPENLFVTRSGDGMDLVKVLDFGIAKLRRTQANNATGTGVTMGTAYYMSPEQARGAAQVDERSDVWSLGVVLYELLSGRTPFAGQQFLEIVHQILNVSPVPLINLSPGLNPALAEIVERAMSKGVDGRWPSTDAFAQALAPFGGSLGAPPLAAGSGRPAPPTEASPQTTVGGIELRAPSAKKRGRRVVASAVGLALGLLVAGTAWFVGLRFKADGSATEQGVAAGSPTTQATVAASSEPFALTADSFASSSTSVPNVASTSHAASTAGLERPRPNTAAAPSSVRSEFEQRIPSSNSAEPPSSASAAPSPSPSEQRTAPSPRKVIIDHDNPYYP